MWLFHTLRDLWPTLYCSVAKAGGDDLLKSCHFLCSGIDAQDLPDFTNICK